MIHTDITVSKTAWTKVCSNYPFVCVQLKGQGSLLVQIKEGPDSDAPLPADISGAAISGDGANMSMGGLPEGMDVWVRSRQDNSEIVNVLAY
jgi:hypothetical protein